MSAALLELTGVTKTYINGDIETPVLHGVDLAVQAGEFVSLMGPSGSGKSTLMHIMSLLDRADTGAYLFSGHDVGQLDPDARAKLRLEKIGFVFQAFHLLPRLTVLENVMLPLLYTKESPDGRRRRAKEVLAEVGLTEREDYLPSQLSGGQKQRVAIARALVNNPTVIFADEPTGNLDSVSSNQVLEILRDLSKKKGRTIVMVTHETEAAAFSDRIIRIRDGKITA
ncbi:MAG: ABC transporter ATP-binding protein [Patescibacteria group bacterium]